MRYRIDTERVDLFDVNIVITMNVRLDTEVPYSELESAFGKACRCHEVLCSKVVIEPSGEAYYIDNGQPCSSISETDLTLTELIRDNERKRFRIEDGEFMRVFSAPDGIVFMMHHLGGDGKSLLYFIETFMNSLAGRECPFVPFRSLGLNDLPAKSRMPLFYRLLAGRWNRKWSKVRKVFSFDDMDVAYKEFWADHKTTIEITRYEKEELASLLERAKDAGVSLTAYLITDMIKDLKTKADIGLAVDGRTDKNRSMGNQATGISVCYRYDVNRSFEENARTVHRLMKKKLTDDRYRYFVLQFMGMLDTTLKDALNLEHAGQFTSRISSHVAELLGYGSKVKDISITNLTRADIPPDYDGFSIEEITFIPPVVSYGKNVIGIVTAGDTMVMTRRVYSV